MRPKKKNAFFTLLCSFLPGAAEMYMGFMKLGLSLMSLFVFSVMILSFTDLGDVAFGVATVIWFFGFFHARNLVVCDAQEFESLTDRYIWEEFTEGKTIKLPVGFPRRWLAWILIFVGVAFLWQSIGEMIYFVIPDELWQELYPVIHNIPGVIFSVIIILIGIKLIQGKKVQIARIQQDAKEVFEKGEIYGEDN